MNAKLTHRRGVWLMVACALLWSIAGVVTRGLDSARGFEITFWRSFFCALSLLLILGAWRGPRALLRSVRAGGRALWLSGLCWSVMFTAFMLALSLTTVANTLITLALGPLFTALLARLVLGHRLAPRTWIAIALAAVGIAWMYGDQVGIDAGRPGLGFLVALGAPIAGAVNWTLLQHSRGRGREPVDLLPAVLLGAVISSLTTLPMALPFSASAHDLRWLALLGLAQLAIPGLLAVVSARVLEAPEIALLALLEIVFGILWAWLGAGETPGPAVLGGGALVLAALAGNEWLGWRGPPRPLAA